MIGSPPLQISLDNLRENSVVADIVYSPLETNLLVEAKIKGHTPVDVV